MKRAIIVGATLALVLSISLPLIYLKLLRERAPTVIGSAATQYAPHAQPTGAVPTTLPWPTYGYDAARVRSTSAFKLRPPYRRSWTFHGHSLLEFPPVVGYGKLFINNFNGHLFAIKAATGKPIWAYRSGRCGWSSPALADGLVITTFIGSSECHSSYHDGQVAAFDADSGALRWLRTVGPSESSPLIYGATVYVGDWNGNVWALELRSGAERWSSHLSGAIKGSLASDGSRLFIGTYSGDLYALNRQSGDALWRSGGHGAFYSSPAVAYGRVFIGSLDDGIYAFGAKTGDLLWSRPTGSYVYASPAIFDHLILVGSYDSHFYALDAATGVARWSFAANGRISGAASVIDGIVYFSTFNERTYALKANNGAMVSSWPDGKYSPAVADHNHLYLVGLGRLYAMARS